MKPSFELDGQRLGHKRLRMPQALGALALALFQVGAPAWLTGGLVGAASFLGTGLGQLALAAASIGLSLAFQKKPSAPSPSDVQSNIRQEISPRRRVYGQSLVGSVIVFGFRRGEKTYVLHYICEGPIAGFVSVRLDKKPVTLDEDGFVEQEQYLVGGRARVQILTTLGTMTDGPFAELISAFPELDTPLTPFRHRGCVMALQIIEQVPANDLADVYPNNLPSLQFVIQALSEVLDPRTETYGYSDNAGCCLLTEIMNVYGLTHESTEDINFQSFADFADHSDEDVTLKAGGTESRWRVAGTITMDGENEARILAISTICNADVYMDPQGRIAVRQKLRQVPGIALRARNGDHLDFQMEGGRGLQKQFNVATVSYTDPALNYKLNEVSWALEDLVTEDGQRYSQPVSATLCPSATQAMRIGKLSVYENNPDFVGSLTSGPQALDLLEDDVFTLDLSPEETFERIANTAGGPIEYDGDAMTVSAQFVVFRPGATDWVAAVDEQEDVTIPPELPSNVDDVLLDVTVTVELLNNSAPVLNFSWVADGAGVLPDSYSQQVEVSAADADEWSTASVNQDNNTAQFGPVADGGAYDWRIRNVASGKTFDWQLSTVPVSVTADTVAPKSLSNFAQATAGPHYGNAPMAFTTKSDPHLARIAIYRAPSGVALDKATHFVTLIGASPGSTFTYTDGDFASNMLSNGAFSSDTIWTKGTGWTIGSGVATKAAGTASNLDQAITLTAGDKIRYAYDVTSYSAGNVRFRLEGTTSVLGIQAGATGTYRGSVTVVTGNNTVRMGANAAFSGSIDNVYAFVNSTDYAPEGDWDYYAIPENISRVEGPQFGPVAITVT